MFAVTVHIRVNKEEIESFLPMMLANARKSLATEEGCLQFDVATDPSRPDEVFLYELYKDAAAFDDHLQQPHFKTFDADTADLIAEKRVVTYSRVTQ